MEARERPREAWEAIEERIVQLVSETKGWHDVPDDRTPRIHLVRHGETAWTISGQHTGRTDVPLTENGERDAQALSASVCRMTFAMVLTSPLQRARRTAELAGFGGQAEVEPDLREWDYGLFEGRRTTDIRADRPRWRLFEDECPGGETVSELAARADRVVTRIRAAAAHVLLFGHRDIFRVLAARWLGLDARDGRHFYLTTGSLSVLGYHHDVSEPVIRLWNAVPKREPDPQTV